MIRRLVWAVGTAPLVLITPTFASFAYADAATDLAKARADLLGQSGREWIKQRVVVSMGGDKHCTAGETYNFHSNGNVTIALCVNRLLSKRNVPWTLTTSPPLDVNIAFDGRSYQLSFSGTARSPQMRWRKLGQIKPEVTTDILLGLSKD